MKTNGVKGFVLNVDFATVINRLENLGAMRVSGTHHKKVVNDFKEDVNKVMPAFYKPGTFLEYIQVEYHLDGVRYILNKWPMIPAFLEVDAISFNVVMEKIEKLNVRRECYSEINADFLYGEKYGINLRKVSELRFSNEELQMISCCVMREKEEENAETYLAV